MAHTKAGGSAKNLRDSNPKYLGTKLHDGELAKPGNIIVRQRGTRIVPGRNVRLGKDHTIYALVEGIVKFKEVRKKSFDGQLSYKKQVSVVAK